MIHYFNKGVEKFLARISLETRISGCAKTSQFARPFQFSKYARKICF